MIILHNHDTMEGLLETIERWESLKTKPSNKTEQILPHFVDDGKAAFPIQDSHSSNEQRHFGTWGISQRNYLAAHAPKHVCDDIIYRDPSSADYVTAYAKAAYIYADAMIALENNKPHACGQKKCKMTAIELKIGDCVEVVGPFGKGSNLNVMVGLCGEIVGIDYRCVRVGLENGVWDFPATNLRYAKAEFVESGKFTLEEIENAFFSHNHGGDEGGEGEYLHRKNTWKSFCRFLDLRIEQSLEKES